jgi:homoserine trans-succinylase
MPELISQRHQCRILTGQSLIATRYWSWLKQVFSISLTLAVVALFVCLLACLVLIDLYLLAGIYVEFDLFGVETSFYQLNESVDMPR